MMHVRVSVLELGKSSAQIDGVDEITRVGNAVCQVENAVIGAMRYEDDVTRLLDGDESGRMLRE